MNSKSINCCSVVEKLFCVDLDGVQRSIRTRHITFFARYRARYQMTWCVLVGLSGRSTNLTE
ncbi:hypothetical protein KFK09_001171 [Dendrobium nobile]|uniref:Uncharacterized protein n=1 Tax=Dendrobium nobile TaxID=94219 RepID=A0A8T3C8W3_DENNO|nr:hypothetical protein KFK09_001171 [Dendrobium nobile]